MSRSAVHRIIVQRGAELAKAAFWQDHRSISGQVDKLYSPTNMVWSLHARQFMRR